MTPVKTFINASFVKHAYNGTTLPLLTTTLKGSIFLLADTGICMQSGLEGDAYKILLVRCGISQKWLLLELKLKLVVKTVGQEL